MTAAPKPKTPLMHLPLRSDVTHTVVDEFCKAHNKLTLAQVVENVTVTEELITSNGSRAKHLVIRIKFYSLDECKKAYHITAREIERALTGTFAAQLRKEIINELKKLATQWKALLSDIDVGQSSLDARRGGGGADSDDDMEEAPPRRDDDDSEMGDGDADTVKRALKTKEVATYSDDESDDDDDDEIIQPADEEEEEDKGKPKQPAATPAVGKEAFIDKLGGIATSFSYKKDAAMCTFELMVRTTLRP